MERCTQPHPMARKAEEGVRKVFECNTATTYIAKLTIQFGQIIHLKVALCTDEDKSNDMLKVKKIKIPVYFVILSVFHFKQCFNKSVA